jgi:hypothetical protein
MAKLSSSCERITKLVLTTFVFCGAAWAADDPFVGTWTLNIAKSKFDPGPPVRSRTVTVEPAGDEVKWSIEQVDANGKLGTVVETLKLDGKDYPRTVTGSMGGPGGDTIALKRIDAYTLEETLKKGGKVVATYKQVVSKDGKERTATQMTGTNAAGQPVHSVLVFDKQSR